MNKTTACMLILLVLLLGAITSPLVAQEDTYVVQKGDNLWKLAGAHLDSEKLWKQIYKDNPFLQETGRRFEKDGIVYVMIRPGEKLVGLEKLGIMANMTPIEQLKLPEPPAKIYHVATTPTWVWWPLALAILLTVGSWLIYRMLSQDPVNSRPAMVQGGVTEVTAPTAIQQVAARTAGYDRATSTAPGVYQRFTILRQTAGRIWGVLTVRYADGRSVPRRLSGERAFQAEVRFPNGQTETLYMLQGCGNDLRYDGISRYLPGSDFRFEADPAVVVVTPVPTAVQATPEPPPAVQTAVAPEPAPVAPPAEPAEVAIAQTEPPAVVAEVIDDGSVTFEFRRSTHGKPNMIRLNGPKVDEMTFTTRGRETTFRYVEVEEEVLAEK